MRKIIALFKIRILEIERDGQDRALLERRDPAIVAAREVTRNKLAAARADFAALHAPGVRFVWGAE